MTENVFEYIEILLPRHRCITLPGFGAFILNNEVDNNLISSDISTIPSCSIIFNSRLQHDDGVLSTYLQSMQGISYEKANKDLQDTIRQMRSSLLINKVVECGSIGKIELIDSNLVFTQNKDYIFPQHYGLTPVGLKTLSAIEKYTVKETKVISLKKKLITTAAGVAAVLLLALPSTHINDSTLPTDIQQAGYLNSLAMPTAESEDNAVILPIEDMKTELPEPKSEIVPSTSSKTSTRTYYLIIAGESTLSKAEKTLERYVGEGFENAKIVSSPDRHRIYIAAFSDKKEAEQYVIQFRKDNPKHETAWVFSKRNS